MKPLKQLPFQGLKKIFPRVDCRRNRERSGIQLPGGLAPTFLLKSMVGFPITSHPALSDPISPPDMVFAPAQFSSLNFDIADWENSFDPIRHNLCINVFYRFPDLTVFLPKNSQFLIENFGCCRNYSRLFTGARFLGPEFCNKKKQTNLKNE